MPAPRAHGGKCGVQGQRPLPKRAARRALEANKQISCVAATYRVDYSDAGSGPPLSLARKIAVVTGGYRHRAVWRKALFSCVPGKFCVLSEFRKPLRFGKRAHPKPFRIAGRGGPRVSVPIPTATGVSSVYFRALSRFNTLLLSGGLFLSSLPVNGQYLPNRQACSGHLKEPAARWRAPQALNCGPTGDVVPPLWARLPDFFCANLEVKRTLS